MSNCDCPQRSRFGLWLAIYVLFMQSCTGCGIHDSDQDRKIRDLEYSVSQCNSEINQLKWKK